MSVFAIVPARGGSKGIPFKNLKRLGDKSLIAHAVSCAHAAGIELVRITTDIPHLAHKPEVIWRPEHLATDSAAMIDVVKHALGEIPGEPDQIIVLLQPTQPFRTPEHIRQAITLLQESGADSVVSVVELPKTHHPNAVLEIEDDDLQPRNWLYTGTCDPLEYWHYYAHVNARRQDAPPVYIRDGTVYAFWRGTVDDKRSIYGQRVKPLIIAPDDTCELDTESDWAAVERRWKERA